MSRSARCPRRPPHPLHRSTWRSPSSLRAGLSTVGTTGSWTARVVNNGPGTATSVTLDGVARGSYQVRGTTLKANECLPAPGDPLWARHARARRVADRRGGSSPDRRRTARAQRKRQRGRTGRGPAQRHRSRRRHGRPRNRRCQRHRRTQRAARGHPDDDHHPGRDAEPAPGAQRPGLRSRTRGRDDQPAAGRPVAGPEPLLARGAARAGRPPRVSPPRRGTERAARAHRSPSASASAARGYGRVARASPCASFPRARPHRSSPAEHPAGDGHRPRYRAPTRCSR